MTIETSKLNNSIKKMRQIFTQNVEIYLPLIYLVPVSHLFAHTKSLGTHQVQASWLDSQINSIVFQIIGPIIRVPLMADAQ
jgi:hypothetical protein